MLRGGAEGEAFGFDGGEDGEVDVLRWFHNGYLGFLTRKGVSQLIVIKLASFLNAYDCFMDLRIKNGSVNYFVSKINLLRKSFLKLNCKPIQCSFPISNRHRPLFSNVLSG